MPARLTRLSTGLVRTSASIIANAQELALVLHMDGAKGPLGVLKLVKSMRLSINWVLINVTLTFNVQVHAHAWMASAKVTLNAHHDDFCKQFQLLACMMRLRIL